MYMCCEERAIVLLEMVSGPVDYLNGVCCVVNMFAVL